MVSVQQTVSDTKKLISHCQNENATDSIINVLAPAKINLFLHITRKRPNGYHELESLMSFTEFGDTISFKSCPTSMDPQLTISGEFSNILSSETMDSNLIIQTYNVIKAKKTISDHYSFHLEKNIPIQAGIGGGSADAAAIIRGIEYLQNTDDNPLLDDTWISEKLGADIPACIASQTVMVRGIGEEITPIESHCLSGMNVVLVNSRDCIPTKKLFQQLSTHYSEVNMFPFEKKTITLETMINLLQRTKNDLTDAAITLAPNVQNVLTMIEKQDGCYLSRMSGSGATCFGIFKDKESASNAYRIIKQKQPKWWITQTRFL